MWERACPSVAGLRTIEAMSVIDDGAQQSSAQPIPAVARSRVAVVAVRLNHAASKRPVGVCHPTQEEPR